MDEALQTDDIMIPIADRTAGSAIGYKLIHLCQSFCENKSATPLWNMVNLRAIHDDSVVAS